MEHIRDVQRFRWIIFCFSISFSHIYGMNTLEFLTNTKDPFIPLSTLCKEACDTYLGLMRSIKTRHHQLDSEDDDDDAFLLSLQTEREERENHFKQLIDLLRKDRF